VQAIRPMGAQILMGKNTLMKRCIRLYCENKKDDSWGAMLDDLVGNVGVLFVRDDFQVTLSHTHVVPTSSATSQHRYVCSVTCAISLVFVVSFLSKVHLHSTEVDSGCAVFLIRQWHHYPL
jgi:Ribosomal protein L10